LQTNQIHSAHSATQTEAIESGHSTTQTEPIENTYSTTQPKLVQGVDTGTQVELTVVSHADTGTQTQSTKYANTDTQTQSNEHADIGIQTKPITLKKSIKHAEVATQTESTEQRVVTVYEQRELDNWVVVYKSDDLIDSPAENWIATVEDEYALNVVNVGEERRHCVGHLYKNTVYLLTFLLPFILFLSVSAGLRTQPGAFGFGSFPVDNKFTRFHALVAQKTLEWAGPFEVYM
jgi:hypothetical protein